MDALSEILGSLRIETGLLCRAKLGAPWAVHTRGAPGAIFHAVMAGECWVRHVDDPKERRLVRGDLVLLARGDAHVMCDDPSTPPVPITSITTPAEPGCVASAALDGGGAVTEILCGTFRFRHGAGDALRSLLPPIVVVSRGEAETVEWFDVTLALVEREVAAGRPGSGTVVARLLDVLVVQLLRAAATSLPRESAGWLAAVQNDGIGRALALIHTQPATRWSVESLAARVGMSRSVFAQRFKRLVGEGPAQYLARWRMQAAADLLATSELSNAQLAERVGYESEDAFAKAFKAHVGMTPREFRRRAATRV